MQPDIKCWGALGNVPYEDFLFLFPRARQTLGREETTEISRLVKVRIQFPVGRRNLPAPRCFYGVPSDCHCDSNAPNGDPEYYIISTTNLPPPASVSPVLALFFFLLIARFILGAPDDWSQPPGRTAQFLNSHRFRPLAGRLRLH